MSDAAVQEEQTESAPEEPKPDLAVILPEEGEVEIDGIRCTVKRLKTIEMLSLVRVLTRGLGQSMQEVRLDFDSEEVASDLAALMVIAIPEAVDEFVTFLHSVVVPIDSTRHSDLKVALANPPIETLLDVAEVIATQEKDDLKSLVGKAQSMWTRMQSLYGGQGKKEKRKRQAG